MPSLPHFEETKQQLEGRLGLHSFLCLRLLNIVGLLLVALEISSHVILMQNANRNSFFFFNRPYIVIFIL